MSIIEIYFGLAFAVPYNISVGIFPDEAAHRNEMSDEKENGLIAFGRFAAVSECLFSQPQTAEFLVHFMRNERCTSVPLRVCFFCFVCLVLGLQQSNAHFYACRAMPARPYIFYEQS